MFQLTIVDTRDYTLLFEETYVTENEARQGAITWFRQKVGDVIAESVLGKEGDAYDRVVRYCEGPDRIQFHIALV